MPHAGKSFEIKILCGTTKKMFDPYPLVAGANIGSKPQKEDGKPPTAAPPKPALASCGV